MNKISGIYKIINNVNGKIYIGSSEDIERRWYHHKNCLNKGTHINKHLQAAWNKYGENSFSFEIVEKCNPEDNLEIEQKYLDMYWDEKILYNIARYAEAPMKGRTHTEATKAFLSQIRTGKNVGEKNPMYGSHLSTEQKKNLSDRFSGVNNPMYGKHLSEETKEKISKANSGRKKPEYLKARLRLEMLGSNNHFYGKKHTKESLKLMSKNRTGLLKGAESPVSRKVVRISQDGDVKIFDTVTQAASESNAQRSHIALVCKGKRKHAGGYTWKYYEDYQHANPEVSGQITNG